MFKFESTPDNLKDALKLMEETEYGKLIWIVKADSGTPLATWRPQQCAILGRATCGSDRMALCSSRISTPRLPRRPGIPVARRTVARCALEDWRLHPHTRLLRLVTSTKTNFDDSGGLEPKFL